VFPSSPVLEAEERPESDPDEVSSGLELSDNAGFLQFAGEEVMLDAGDRT